MKVPTKGILKNSTSFEGTSSHKCSASRGTKWDEMNILATHHPPDKDYGHMKIEEPKTPYSYHGEDSGDEGESCTLDSNLLTEKLQVDTGEYSPKRPENIESDEEEETSADKEKRKSFEYKRKAHYNEFMAVKLARQLMQNEEEDDDGSVKEPRSSEVDDVDVDQDDEGNDHDLETEGVGNKENAESTAMDTQELSNETAAAGSDTDVAIS